MSIPPRPPRPTYIPVRRAADAAAVAANLPLASLVTTSSASEVLSTAVAAGGEAVLYATDLRQVADQLNLFRAELPRVTPYYAVKCNPDPILLSFLAQLGVSFDCASSYEIALTAAMLGDRPIADRVVFANPFKAVDDLKHARGLGIRLMTFDSTDELEKIAKHFPAARLLLRTAVEDSDSQSPLSSKFGAQLDEVDAILDTVNRLHLNLVGVAFHVGSGCTSASAYGRALKVARLVFDRAYVSGLPKLSVLDIGGGFPGYDGETSVTFREIARVVRSVISSLFKEDVEVIAEPGRYFVASAYSLAVEVALVTERKGERNCYLSDGVYGSFRDAWLFRDVKYVFDVLHRRGSSGGEGLLELVNLYGPTREPVDIIARNVKLPQVRRGDWLWCRNMGSYTMCLNTRRSGVDRFKTVYFFRMDAGDAELKAEISKESNGGCMSDGHGEFQGSSLRKPLISSATELPLRVGTGSTSLGAL